MYFYNNLSEFNIKIIDIFNIEHVFQFNLFNHRISGLNLLISGFIDSIV